MMIRTSIVRSLIMFACLTTLLVAAPGAGKMVRYEDRQNNFSFDRPESWEQAPKTNEQVAVIFRDAPSGAADRMRENIKVVVRQLPESAAGVKLEQVMESVKAGIKQQMPGVTIDEEGPTQLHDADAYRIVYTGKMKDADIDAKFVQVLAIKNMRLFAITFTSTPSDLPKYQATLDAMLKSFKLGE